MILKDKSTIETLLGRAWMYRSTVYQFNDYVESNGWIIISTDVKAIKVKEDDIQSFAKECLPTQAPAKVIHGGSIRGLDPNIFQEITGGLMDSFRQIQTVPVEELKTTVVRAKNKIKIANSVTQLAKVVLDAARLQDK